MKKSAKAVWTGNLKHGRGMLNTESGALTDQIYSYAKRFGNEPGSNPEELIAAAHSGCFAMQFAAELEKKNFVADSLNVNAEVTLEGSSITDVFLDVIANVPGATEDEVRDAANIAKTNCPVSKLLKANITMDLQVISTENYVQTGA